MGRLIYSFVRWIQRMMLKRRGWVLSDNVMISIHGVRKIGGGKIYCADNVNINAECMLVGGLPIIY